MKRILIATTIGLTVLTAGCTGTGTGTTGTPTPTNGSATPTSGSDSEPDLEALKSCDLLTEADVASLGLKYPGEATKVGTADSCDWQISGKGGLTVGVRAKAGVKDLNLSGANVSQTKVGKYDATKVEAPDGATSMCTYVISVSESSSVSIIGNVGLISDDTAAACERASKASDLITPKLP